MPFVTRLSDDGRGEALDAEDLSGGGRFEEDTALIGDVHPHVRSGTTDIRGWTREEHPNRARIRCLGVDPPILRNDDGGARSRGELNEIPMPAFLARGSQGIGSSSSGVEDERVGATTDS